MLTKSLRGNQIFIPIMIFILWTIGFFLLNVNNIQENSLLLSFGLLVLSVGTTTFAINSFPYFKDNYFFVFLFAIGFLFIGCCLQDLNFFAGLFFLHLIIGQILFKRQLEEEIFNSFDLGFYMGLAIIFYPPFWVFGVFLLFHFIILGKTQFQNLILSLFGLVVLGILGIEILALMDKWYLVETFYKDLSFNRINLTLEMLFLLPILLMTLIGLIDYYTNINRQSVNKKGVFFDAILWFIFALIYIGLYGGVGEDSLVLILIPITLFIANWLTYSKIIWQSELILWLFIVCLGLYRYNYLIQVPELFRSITF